MSPYSKFPKAAHREATTLKVAAIATGWFMAERFDAWVNPNGVVGQVKFD